VNLVVRRRRAHRMSEGLEDPVLGRFEWDAEWDCWAGVLDLSPGCQFVLLIDFNKYTDNWEVVVAQAREWVDRVRQREPEYRAWSAARLVGDHWIKNESKTVADVERILRLEFLDCRTTGDAWLRWADDRYQLSEGYGIFTRLDSDGECVEVRLS